MRRYGFDLAAVVSASHNPYEDNGIKFFGPDGTKLVGRRRRTRSSGSSTSAAASAAIGRVRELHGAAGDYVRELEPRFSGLDLSGRRILLDCANGATYRVAPEIFRRLGADVELVAIDPDGRNINRDCGSTHVAGLAERVAVGRLRDRLRLRRRRRPRAGRRPVGRGGGRRRADGAGARSTCASRAGCPATAWP